MPGCEGRKGRYCHLRTGRGAAPDRATKGARLVGSRPGSTMPEEGTSGRVCRPEAAQSIGMPRADGTLHAILRYGAEPCRRLQKIFPQ